MLTDGLREMGLDVIDSWANFVTVVLGDAEQARNVNESLLREGIIIRPLDAFGLPHCIRISVGTAEANELCLAAMRPAVHNR